MAPPSAPDIERIARRLAGELNQHEPALVTGNPVAVEEAITRAIAANFAIEANIEREAEKLLDQMGAQARNMDRPTLLAGLKARIAKQRGFAL